MVKLGKMMWNAKVKPAWMRSSRTGSRFIAGLADRPFPDGPQYRPARRNRTAGLRPGALRPWTSGKIPNAEQSSRAILRRSCRLFGGTSQEIAMSDTIGETTAAAGHVCALDRYFGLTRNGTEPRTEIIAGVTTFLTMAYIVFVNPQILGAAGMDQGAVFAATCLAAAASTLTMGIYANYPIALETSGVIVAHPATLVTLGDLTKPAAILALVGFVLIAALNQRRIIGGTLLGIPAGGRTGLTAVVVALCFLLALFFAPLAGMIPAYASAAALLYVACIMARGLAEIEWDDVTESAPAVIAAVTMPLTYSIATGIGLGFITYVLAKFFAGRFSQLSPAVIVLAALFALKFAVSG